MARISESELERLKAEIPIERLVVARGIELKRHGADLVGRCPFHEDHGPSLVLTPQKNLWHCLGACQTGGSVIDWVMKAEGVSFRHAVELLRADLAASPATSSPPPVRARARKLPPPVARDADDQEVLRQVVGYYHETLKQSPEAMAYLEARGLRSSEMLERFRLGFANRTLGYRLPPKTTKTGADMRGRLQKLGLLRESGHEHFNGSLVIPIFDEEGQVAGLYGRKINTSLRKGTPLHLYLPGPHRGVWNLEALRVSKEIILCEALIDALTFWCAGFRNVTTSYGIEGFTEEHLAAFKKYGTERVLIAYDRDEAGDRGAEALAKRLCEEGISCYRILFPRGMDANEYALQNQPAEKSLELVIRKATWMGKGTEAAPRAELEVMSGTLDEAPSGPAPSVEVPDLVAGDVAPVPELGAAEPDPIEPDEPVSPASPTAAPSPLPPAPVPELAAPVSPPAPAPVRAAPAPALTQELPAATPEPPPPRPPEVPIEVKDEEVVLKVGDRRYRVRGLGKNLSYNQLRVNLLCSRAVESAARTGAGFHVDTLDLYSARQRVVYAKQASEELGVAEEVIKKDLGAVLLTLEELQEQQIQKTLEPKDKTLKLTDAETQSALELLKDPALLDRILKDFERCGVVGEEMNKLMGYLAAVSRKLEEPLAVLIQSSSSAGKTSLMDAILAFVPPEERVKYSAMTGQSLFYMEGTELRHKILALVEEEGAERASYALKLLQSEGELTIASTGKDPQTGKLVTHEYRVEGPVMLFLTTTAIEIDEELLNRCLVLTINEDREQTRAIHRRQREQQTLSGLLAQQDRDSILKQHRDAQRLLRPLLVANPYAKELTFRDDCTRTRRDHMKYLTLIRSIALLHQYQRPIKTVEHQGKTLSYIEVTLEDIEVANRIAHQVLGHSLDELPPQTRRLLLLLDQMVTEACARLSMDRADFRFSRREVREHTGWGNTQLKLHLHRLEEMEYLLTHRGDRGQSFVYELRYDGKGKDGTPFLPGLLDVAALRSKPEYDTKWSGVNEGWSGSGRPPVGPKSAPGRGGDPHESARNGAAPRPAEPLRMKPAQ